MYSKYPEFLQRYYRMVTPCLWWPEFVPKANLVVDRHIIAAISHYRYIFTSFNLQSESLNSSDLL